MTQSCHAYMLFFKAMALSATLLHYFGNGYLQPVDDWNNPWRKLHQSMPITGVCSILQLSPGNAIFCGYT